MRSERDLLGNNTEIGSNGKAEEKISTKTQSPLAEYAKPSRRGRKKKGKG
jgi:hypothetical protein